MSEYYLLTGYLIRDTSKDTDDRQFPQNYTFLELKQDVKIYIAYHKSNKIFLGNFVIETNSMAEAYHVADIIKGFYNVFYSWSPRVVGFYLKKLRNIPNAKWTTADVNNAIIDEDISIDSKSVDNGQVLIGESLEHLKCMFTKFYTNDNLCESLNHLSESRYLFDGFMTDSYYECHYKNDRAEMPEWLKEKMFYENRYRYQSAFIAAFKGIESFFKVNDFKEREIERLFNNINYHDINFDTIYKRRFEIFLGEPKEIKYGELLAHFLKLRNVVAAHHNKKPPVIITEDNIHEIQAFLLELICKALES